MMLLVPSSTKQFAQKRQDNDTSCSSSFSIQKRHNKERQETCIEDSSVLPLDFSPNNYTVICGRGKVCANAIGNKRLKILASLFVSKYSKARNKEEKTVIVTKIMDMVVDACPDERGTFVKHKNGRYYTVHDSLAREKIGAALRELLFTKYKSSSKSKQIARDERRKSVQSIISTDPKTSISTTQIQSQSNLTETIQEKREPIDLHTPVMTYSSDDHSSFVRYKEVDSNFNGINCNI